MGRTERRGEGSCWVLSVSAPPSVVLANIRFRYTLHTVAAAAPALAAYSQGCSGAGTVSPLFFDSGDASPTPPLFGLKFVQKLVHCCNWLLTETQCKNFCLSVVLGVPHFFFRTTPPASLSPRSSLTTSLPLKPSFSAQPSHCSPSFSSSALTTRITRGLFTDACYHNVFFYFLVFFCFPLFSCWFRAVK